MVEDPRVALEQVQVADQGWRAALEESDLAPPDSGFPARVRRIADASEQEAAALRLADSMGMGWQSAPGARSMRLTYELRPGGNRPGPQDLWDRFDAAVQRLGEAMEGVATSAVARSFAELSGVARELCGELEPVYTPARRRAS